MFLEAKLNIFLQAFKFERRIEDSELQVDVLLETPSAKMKIRNRAAIGHLTDTLKFMWQFGIPFRRHRDGSRLEPVSDIKDIDTTTGNFRAILQLHCMGNSELAEHLRKSSSNVTYLSPDIRNELITQIGKEISSEVKDASCFVVFLNEATDKLIKSKLSIVNCLNGNT